VAGTGGVNEELEESLMKLQQMLTQRHVAPFRPQAQEMLTSLSDTAETLERWVKVQQMWCSLESVFLSGDIAKQMPTEAKKFTKVDKDWQKLMQTAAATQNVVESCANELLRASLPGMYGELEKCQKSLESYLEQKRNKFPRFFFVSNPGLLLILSQGSEPLAMNEHYEKVFDALEKVDHNRKDKYIIEAMNGDDQRVPFSTPVKATGNIEDWLGELLKKMQMTMKDLCRICAGEIVGMGNDISHLRQFVDGNFAQFALLGIQLLWTIDCQSALEQCRSKPKIVAECNKKQQNVLHEMSSWCLQDLGSKSNRRKVETLVTIHVHQRDVMADLAILHKAKRISDSNDFEWLKQARFYWRPNSADECTPDGACVISITDVDFNYQYEYLGSKERLVVTPLTDRCYITLAQALGMYFGGAPAGPAGTGKTETVKDLGRTLGIFVVVTNCTDQQKYTDCAKIFKGLCQGGLWGCFDEFNRILLPVLSVVAQQVLAITNAKKAGVEYFQFPGDPQNVLLKPCCGFFITMNPGYAGRQELPENLKALFRGVAMMTPDFQIIKKVKLCSVGYAEFDLMSQKFFVLYATCKEQLSAQKHYDWGLRNILAVLRTAGQTKRDNLEKSEHFLIYRTLRDMNLSKLVAQDVPLFLSLLADLFPAIPPPPKGEYPQVEDCLKVQVEKEKLVYHAGWVNKVIQLYETTRVRHGIMLVGPAGGGKTKIYDCLSAALTEHLGKLHKQSRFNPKALRAQEMYGEVDLASGEWTTGVFAAMWAKFNNKNNNYNTWILADGPVDAIWIEDLNTVLDDNKLLTLANGDRIPMTDNVKAMFEVETLMNASPATVSRAGIIFVSDTDLDWAPVMEAWIRLRPEPQRAILREMQAKWLGENNPNNVGHCIDFLVRNTKMVINTARVAMAMSLCDLFAGLTDVEKHGADLTQFDLASAIEKLFLYCLCWSMGALLEQEDRVKFHHWLKDRDTNKLMPVVQEGETIYEYYVDLKSMQWELWRPPLWEYPQGAAKLDFSNLLVPTMDSTRAIFLVQNLHKQKKAVLVVGAEGTAKTSTNLMFFKTLSADTMLVKRVNFSSATTPFMCQNSIEVELDKRGGRSFGPPGGKKMTIFIDDLSMPEMNKWGDQPTLEMVRLVIEYSGFPFLDKDKRGDFKICEDLQYIAAMGHPGGGKNDIPNRLKKNFFIFNLVLPSIVSINDIYGQMLRGRFPAGEFDADIMMVVNKLTRATISLWRTMKEKMLPTPAKFHYIFNMRELSRVFQGVLLTPKETIKTGGGQRAKEGKIQFSPASIVLNLWKHECERVFCDKLTNNKDKDMYYKFMGDVLNNDFPPEIVATSDAPFYMVNFLRDDVYDEDGVLQEEAPKVYEPGGTLQQIRDRVEFFAGNYNRDFPSKKMELVLFDDALRHLLRINRLIEMPRGSALLVGVGGSGKQSLTRLTSYICRSWCFQITLTKSYGMNALIEDLKLLYKSSGHQRKQTTFLFTESEIKDEVFLELINSILMTGEVPGLFAKEEYMAMTADLRNAFIKDRPGLEETQDNMKQYFIDCVRDNLHLILCMSPLNPKFPIRARKFPGLISGPTIDWFLPWPKEALVSVSQGVIKDYPIECTPEVKQNLMVHMGMVHKMVTEVCDEYFVKMRRQVYQTPKSYLSFIQNFKVMYSQKLQELRQKEERVNLGLRKLIQGADDVEAMKIVLAEEQKKLEVATAETNKMLASLEISSAEAKKEGDQVSKIKAKCEEDAARIAGEKAACEADLALAQPYVDQAETAIRSIQPAHIGEIKKLPNPKDIIKLVFDGVMILFMKPLNTVRNAKLEVNKQDLMFIETSFKPYAVAMLNDSRFLQNVVDFGKIGKDKINEETIEFLLAYIDLPDFTPQVAKNASVAAEGLCTWVRAMKYYHEASKVVKPKLEALAVAEAQMDAANKALHAAEMRLEACEARLRELRDMFDNQMAEKKRIEDGAMMLQRKMNQASQLIGGLAGERTRWTEDANNFADMKRRLVGDCAVACAFVSYCGPFNQDFRKYMINEKFRKDCDIRAVPVTKNLDDERLLYFLVDVGTIGDWNMEGLPQDNLSIQNGILVTRSSRFPLLIDPQGQALNWIRNREKDNVPVWQNTTLNDSKLREKLELCMGDGMSLVIVQVEEDIDPMLDPVLEKQFVVKGKKLQVIVSDKALDYDPKFRMYFITRLPNPNFSPELQAKTTVVDFTVTQQGLEEQLLGKVIGKEQKALEEQLNQVLAEVNENRKSLMLLDASLLERLTSNTGNLLEDEELIGVLANTKAKAAEVNQKLIAADETRQNISEKREQFRKVAERGSVLYFSIVEVSLVNCMYQTSLDQFLGLFMDSMDKAEKASLASKRVQNIIETMTYIVYRYINRGLYERDKLTFILIVTLKILITAKKLNSTDLTLFLRGGAALDINSVRRKPFSWMTNEAWLNLVELSQSNKFFGNLLNDMSGNEAMWRRWYEDNEPEQIAIPDYDQRIAEQAEVGPFLKLLLVRALRVDRCILTCKEFIRNTAQMGPKYVEPVTDTMESIFQEMVSYIPVIFLLSVGADPTDSIETLARKRKLPLPAVISLGEGQEPVAIRAMNAAAQNGTWVLLQNCELGIPLMVQMEDLIGKMKDSLDPGFRLFITALPSSEFPLGLLQMSTKVTNEPPAGLRAGILRSYTVLVDQDRLERVENVQWRQLLMGLCFLHSTVQERRKFGPLGWCIPYEYNNGDLTACILFLEKHLYAGAISWPTFQYMVSEVQYGGKITDSLDRRMFKTYTAVWLTSNTCSESFTYNPAHPIFKIPNDFQYKIAYTGTDINEYRRYISSFPDVDSPEIFGLHPNADLTFRVKEVNALFNTLGETQPKGSSGGGGVSREDVVYDKAADLLEKLPEDYKEDDYKEKLKKLGGLAIPLNIFLFQEIQRLQRVISRVRFILQQLQLAIKGEVVMSEELALTLTAMFEAKVPGFWVFTVAGDEFSWILPTLGLWFTSLTARDEQDRSWLNNGRPNSYWLTGFFNPQGMLTAMKQEVTRKHKAQQWELDNVVYLTEVTPHERVDHVRSPPPEGVYIHGLFLDGAAWSKQEGRLVESEPKRLFVPLPVLWASATVKSEQMKIRKEMFGPQGPYEAPCYKYPNRTDRFFIFLVTLMCTPDKNPNHWTLRGVALLCNTGEACPQGRCVASMLPILTTLCTLLCDHCRLSAL
jgi:dynein heavy chain, axonemal